MGGHEILDLQLQFSCKQETLKLFKISLRPNLEMSLLR